MAKSYEVVADDDNVQVVPFDVKTASDPTGATLYVGLVAKPSTAYPASWSSATWGTWDATTSKVPNCLSPTISGTSGAGTLIVAAGTRYTMFAKWTVGSETPVEIVGVLTAR